MNHLDIKRDEKLLFIPDEAIKEYDLIFDENNGNKIIYNGNTWSSVCINCSNPRCIYFEPDEIRCDKFDLSQYHMDTVCPSGAVSEGKESVIIDNEKCIGCGICASRCPFGAVSVNSGKAHVSKADNTKIPSFTDTKENVEKQNKWIADTELKRRIGRICDDKAVKSILIEKDEKSGKIKIKAPFKDQLIQRNLVISLLIQLGNSAQSPRIGVTSERMDCVFQNSQHLGVIEIETGEDTLDVPRNLLDDAAMMQYRFKIEKSEIIPLHICFRLQNKRSEYWRIVSDIKEICNIRINTVTVGALLLMLWNFVPLTDMRTFYLDAETVADNQSAIKKIIEGMLNRPILTDKDTAGFFEIEK